MSYVWYSIQLNSVILKTYMTSVHYYLMEIALDKNSVNAFLEVLLRNPILSTTLIKHNEYVLH